ncbi:MAG: imidazole glycerol phosphate synthase subunit HisH [Parasphingopyxis sp.]|nr:imidazole glycerol phosphate synthase subunit HisH [Sphingomonadales bacterium]
MSVAVIDIGYGNIGSIARAFEQLGAAVRRTADPAEIEAASHVVLPGVGAARHAMERLGSLGLADRLRGLNRPMLGICLGMQLLFESSEEGETPGLGLLPGTVRRIAPVPGLKVPHMGWSRLALRGDGIGLADGDYVFFAHSYFCPDGPATRAAADHGGVVPAVVERGNIVGVQFHPERSAAPGRRFLEAFLDR